MNMHCLAILTGFLCGICCSCSDESTGPSDNDGEARINKNVILEAYVRVHDDIAGRYGASVKFDHVSPFLPDGEFNNAEVYINDVRLSESHWDDEFRLADTLILKEGDEVRLRIKHDSIGVVEKSLFVPPPVATLTTIPELIKNETNTTNQYQLQWTPPQNTSNVGMYKIISRLCHTQNDHGAIIHNFTDAASLEYSLQLMYADPQGTPFPYLAISVVYVAMKEFESLAGGWFQVDAPTAQTATNI